MDDRHRRYAQLAFAIGMISSGVLTLVIRDFYSPWEPVPPWLPARAWLASACGAVMVAGGAALFIQRTAAIAAEALFWLLVLFLALVKTPVVLAEPHIEVRWLDWGQIAVLVAGAWSLRGKSEAQLRAARVLLGVALVPIGLSHFFYLKIATPMVPAFLPFRREWVIFTGIAHVAAGIALLARVWARVAAVLEASMITAFALLVWTAPLFAAPHNRSLWIQLIVTVAVASGVWAVAGRLRVA